MSTSRTANKRRAGSSKQSSPIQGQSWESPSSGPVKKRRRTVKVELSTSIDPNTWRASRIPTDQKITKTNATKLYRLNREDFVGLSFETYESGFSVDFASGTKNLDAHLYCEQDIERKAWEKRGGPEGFEVYLAKLRASWNKRQSRGQFPEPDAYRVPSGRNSRGSVSIVTLPKHLWGRDPYTPNQNLRQLKRNFDAEWIWESCNEALDLPYSEAMSRTSSADREKALVKAIDELGPYPARPPRLSSSPSRDALRAVLQKASNIQDYGDPNIDCHTDPNIEYDIDGFTGDHFWYWTENYLDAVFAALNNVIDEHGLGDQGWKGIRWEVYDKYSESLGGMEYFAPGCARDPQPHWFDSAFVWLEGRLDEDDYGFRGTRAKCQSGRKYNGRLPAVEKGE